MEKFPALIYDLGKIWEVDLYAEKGLFCRINYKQEFFLQLEYEEAKERILIATFLTDVPPGAYRERLFKSALKSNEMSSEYGILCYSDKNNKLTLFNYLSAIDLTGEKLAQYLEKFIKKAHEWKEAVERGGALPVALAEPKLGSPFGLK